MLLGVLVPLLRSSAATVAALALEGTLGLRLGEQFRAATGHRASASELRSWERSIPVLARDLVDAGLGDVEVLLEQGLPLSSMRMDAVLAGRHPDTRRPSYVVVELKQWSSAKTFEGDPTLVVVPGTAGLRSHPVRQVTGYVDYLVDFTRSLQQEPDLVTGAAYLHNVDVDTAVDDLRDLPQTDRGRLFTSARRAEWLAFLKARLDPTVSGAPYADQLLASAVAPSRQLLTVAADEIRQREQFVLLERQRLAHDYVLHAVRRASQDSQKRAVVITGGPGSGKSVIALSLVGELARQGRTVLHATGSRSFTQTLRKVAGSRSPQTQRLFKYFNDFMAAEPNGLDVLVLDEAHRIRETSVSRWTPKDLRHEGRSQVEELLRAARVPVFLLDQYQVVRPGELGTVEEIQSQAAALGIYVERIELDAQFRCGGSELYVRWVKALLGLEGEPFAWPGDEGFVVETAASPGELEARLTVQLEQGLGARMTAGYCWPWSDPRPDGSLVPDVQVGSWSRPWNLKGDRAVGTAPPAALWASAGGGFDQVGCVYTAQGFEYDWSGVLVGPDLVWRSGDWVTRREHNRDPDFRNQARVSDAEFDRLVRNVYKVLLTRGVQGTVLHSTDPETQQHLEELTAPRTAALLQR